MRDSPSPVQGLVAGKYEIVGLIGRGGMGSVWEGRHHSLGTRVAIKFIDAEYVASEEACARFATEARAAATIQSKYAIQIFDHGVTDDGRPYMVMELLVGEPLDKRIDRLGTLTLRDAARVVGQVCRALQRAHDAGIVHRDLKPENIFLVRSPDDDDEIAKVLDFGIAKVKAPSGQGLSSSTKTGAVLGTPYYMSPEQARGLRDVDHRSDLWSLGVIAYKCVTGVLPFEGESVGDLLVKICTGPPPIPSASAPGLPASFDRWFARALERDPAKRFASATDVADALAAAAGLSGRGASPSLAGEPGLWAPTMGSQLGPHLRSESTPPPPAAAVTSAPFTAPASPANSSRTTRGALFAATAAALVGASVGAMAVFKLASPGHPSDVAAAPTASASSSAVGVAETTTPDSSMTNGPRRDDGAPLLAPPLTRSETSKTPSTSSPKTPASPRPKITAANTTPTPSFAPSPSFMLPSKPAPAKASPNPADPGY